MKQGSGNAWKILDSRWNLPSKVLVGGGNDGFDMQCCRINQ